MPEQAARPHALDGNIPAGEPAIVIGAERRFDVVHADVLHLYANLVAELGGDHDLLLAEARIAPGMASGPDRVVAYGAFVTLLQRTAAALHTPDFGLRLAQRQRGGRVIGPVGVVMKNSKTLGQALGYCAKHCHAYSLATRVRFYPDRPNHLLYVGLDIHLDSAPDLRQVVEHALGLATLNVLDITQGKARVRRVHFRHAPQLPLAHYRAWFGCEVLFGQETDGFVLTEPDLLCEIANPDGQVYEMAVSFIEHRFPPAAPPMHARVRGLILRYLGTDACTSERVASEIAMHPRTLQRRLRTEGSSFESIKDSVRREVALRYLRQPDVALTRVAEKLGYAETSVLSRSCYRWFHASPLQVRRNLGKGARSVGRG